MLRNALVLFACLVCVFGRPEIESTLQNEPRNRDPYHSTANRRQHSAKLINPDKEEETAEYWNNLAKTVLTEQITKSPNTGVAKNVIMFLGDGMSLPTIAATRVYLGQQNQKPGEETKLSFEKFPYVGFSKTYCVNRQVADSACSATAYLCGVKANEATIGVTAAVTLRNCAAMQNTSNHVYSVGRWSQLKNKRTGVVTTTRITHASPAGVYAHTAHRDWESDTNVINDNVNPEQCRDIAHQLVHGETGRHLNVILGGGRYSFLPKDKNDEDGEPGYRSDGRNLIDEWKDQKKKLSKSYQYVSNRDELLKVKSGTEYVLGLFSSDHLDYHLDRTDKQPTLQEMTETAIKLLKSDAADDTGYFLFVEGGRIDHAHHNTLARKSLDETVEFHKAIEAAAELTDEADTLIVVTSDHSHTMSLNGYPDRGNDILNIGGIGDDKLPYTTLSYANGPGYRPEVDGKRPDITNDDFTDKNYKYPTLVPLDSETHGGEDVGIFARGPWAHLFNGVLEQNVIAHTMGYASCVGDGPNLCKPSGSSSINPLFILQILSLLLIIRQGRRMM